MNLLQQLERVSLRAGLALSAGVAVSTLHADPVIVELASNPETVEFQGAATKYKLGSSGVDISRTLATGDLNGDGIGDLVVGSSNFSPGGLTYAGAVLIYFGSTNWPATLDMANAEVTLAGDVAGGYLAYSLCAADFDGDGIDDLA